MVDVENGIHSLEPGLFFTEHCLEKGCGKLLSTPSRREKLQNFLYTLKQHGNDFFSAFFILKFATNGKGVKGSKLNMFHHINHCFVLFPFSQSMVYVINVKIFWVDTRFTSVSF